MPDVRLPLAVDMIIDSFSGGTITSMSTYMKNAVLEKHSSDTGDRIFITQRPSINMIEDCSDTVAKVKGRATYYWPTTNAIYMVNDDTIYKGSYGTTIGTITSGVDKCKFLEVGSLLVLIDPQNNEGWTINSGGTLTKITDAQFPSTIAGGGAVLDGYLFLIDDDGIIYHSDLDDATAWTAANFIEAEREPDGGTYCARHYDHIVAMGKGSIEFFYNAGNPVGAVINRRQDVYYNIGVPYQDAIWEDGDDIYFFGRTARGDYGVYLLRNFQIQRISNDTFSSFLTEVYAQNSFYPLLSGFAARGRSFLSLTLHTTPAAISPNYTFVYDSTSNIWSIWETSMSELSGVSGIPVIDWTTSTSSRFGQGILSNGDLITFKGSFDPTDTFNAQDYLENQDDYIAVDYIQPFGTDSSSAITLITRVGHIDNGTNKHKFAHSLEYIGDYTDASQTLTVRYSDTDHITFGSDRTLDLSKRQKLSRLGKYNRRTYELEYSGTEQIRMEALEIGLSGGYV